MLFLNRHSGIGQIKDAEFVELGKQLGIPTFNDCAADTPPVDNLFKYTQMGFDLVTFSGGKGIRGPQSAGLLLGRKDLIEAARLNTSPNANTIGRGMKVNKEEMLGMLVALQLYLNRNHRLSDFHQCSAHTKNIPDIDFVVQHAVDSKIFPELTHREIVSYQLLLPVVVVFDRVNVSSLVDSAVPYEISLSITIQVQFPQHDPLIHRFFKKCPWLPSCRYVGSLWAGRHSLKVVSWLSPAKDVGGRKIHQPLILG